MQWIHDYQLFLFDMDGLLVNTEEIHFAAYKRTCASYGFTLPWTFDRYCEAAHYHSEGLRDQIYAELPELRTKEPDWTVIYGIKKQAVVDLVKEGAVHLMPGVERLLKALEEAGIKRCVVTHSPDELVRAVRDQNPVLDTIPAWVTRHDYHHAKPHPECYRFAISKYGAEKDNIVGFEDTPRGLKALMETPARAVLICRTKYPEIPNFLKYGVLHYPSFTDIPDNKLG